MGGLIGSVRPYLDGSRESDLELTAILPYSDGSGNCLRFRDKVGHLLVWFTKRKVTIAVGDRIRASYTVSSHRFYGGVEQNVIRKVKITNR